MAGNTARRASFAAVAAGLSLVGLVAAPTLAGAAEPAVTEPAPAVEEPTTTTTVAEETTTTTTVKETTTTTLPSQPRIAVLDEVHAPGDKVTVSGGGCLIDGKPGLVGAAFVYLPPGADPNDLDAYVDVPYPDLIEADGTGHYSVTMTIPADTPSGPAGIGTACGDEAETTVFPLDAVGFIVQRPGETAVPGKPDSRALTAAAEDKVSAPKAVKVSPKYTG